MKKVEVNQRGVTLRRADIEEIINLRQEVIIAGTDRDTPYFKGDRDEPTRHYGAFDGEECIGILSLMLNDWQGEIAWQLRGMASREDWRGNGLGRMLLQFAIKDTAVDSGILQFWCNARTGAVSFYEKYGWKRQSDEFTVPGVGPHFKMTYRFERRAKS